MNQPDLDVNDIFDDEEDDEVDDDLLFAGDLFDDEEDEDENESVDDLINEIRILDLVDELDSRQLWTLFNWQKNWGHLLLTYDFLCL